MGPGDLASAVGLVGQRGARAIDVDGRARFADGDLAEQRGAGLGQREGSPDPRPRRAVKDLALADGLDVAIVPF